MYQNFNGQMPQQPFYGGYAYGARPAPRCTQPVTPELQKMLNQQSNELDIRISNTDKIKNWCTHKEPTTGRLALVENSDGTVTCRVCGETFHMVDSMTKDQVQAVCNQIIDIMQTTKTMYLDSPEDFTKAYWQTLSMIQKLPELWDRAYKNFTMYESYTGNVFQANPNINSFAAASGILGGFNVFGNQPYGYGYGFQNPMAPQGWPQQPMQGQPMQQPVVQQPVMGQQPMPNMTQMVYPGGPWDMSQQTATVPYVNQNGQVMPGQPMAPTTMGGAPMAPGFNPLVNTGVPGANMSAPAPTGPAPQVAAQPTTGAEPAQTKTMTV